MKIKFKFELEEKVSIKYDEKKYNCKDIYTVIERKYKEGISGTPTIGYTLYRGMPGPIKVSEEMLEKAERNT